MSSTRTRHLSPALPLLLLLVFYLARPTTSVPVPPPTTTETDLLFDGDQLLQAPSSSSAAQWRSILVRMTAQNPCGSMANYELCRECGKSTGDGNAFYMCCLNEDGVRQFCSDFLNHTID